MRYAAGVLLLWGFFRGDFVFFHESMNLNREPNYEWCLVMDGAGSEAVGNEDEAGAGDVLSV
jgi:hypothetical protein